MANKMTFEQLMAHCLSKSVTARLVPVVGRDGGMEFYIHADGADSDTLDFAVKGSELKPLNRAAGG